MANGFFTEDNGNKSSMRLMSFLSFIIAAVIALITMLKPGIDSTTGIYLTISFLSGAFAPKAIQKWVEEPIKNKIIP